MTPDKTTLVDGSSTPRCDACKGTGTRVLDGAGRAVPEYACRDCDGRGVTTCPRLHWGRRCKLPAGHIGGCQL